MKENIKIDSQFHINLLEKYNNKPLKNFSITNNTLSIEVTQNTEDYHYEINIICKKINDKILSTFHNLSTKYQTPIIKINILSKQQSDYQAIQLFINDKNKHYQNLKSAIKNLSQEVSFEINIRPNQPLKKQSKLAVFDMDSTLIQAEVIVKLAEYAEIKEKVSEITESAMRGEINFTQSFAKRMALLKGLDEKVLQEIKTNLPFTEGVEKMARILKKNNYKLAVLSGGFQYFADYVKDYLNFDYAFANHLDIQDKALTGKTKGVIVDGQRKSELLLEIADKENIPLTQVIAVGDGANDLLMMEKALIGVAYHAKPIVKEQALTNISHYGLDVLPYILGITDE